MDRIDCDLGQAVSLGTTIMAASFEGGVVLGADSRTSTGNYIANRVTDKLTPLAENIYHRLELDQDVGVKTAAQLAKNMVYQNKEMLQAGLIVAGWDKEEGGSVYAVPLGGTLVKCPFAIGGSGSAYIYGLCDRHWKAGMSEEECKAFVQKAVSHAMARDGSSGGCIRTVSISKQGVKRDFVPGHSVPGHYGCD
ncbi:hypothetical protein WJX82_006888 [Trebouxia sp. C0006]